MKFTVFCVTSGHWFWGPNDISILEKDTFVDHITLTDELKALGSHQPGRLSSLSATLLPNELKLIKFIGCGADELN
jgi:hypothetical protein